MNTNFFHNLLNILIVLIPALSTFDWTMFFSPEISLKVVGTLGLIKLAINAYRDGVGGMAAPQPPVEKL
jgi:hypothetical protein